MCRCQIFFILLSLFVLISYCLIEPRFTILFYLLCFLLFYFSFTNCDVSQLFHIFCLWDSLFRGFFLFIFPTSPIFFQFIYFTWIVYISFTHINVYKQLCVGRSTAMSPSFYRLSKVFVELWEVAKNASFLVLVFIFVW